jgi:uncharacterized protein YndB with AHSA1/START domain
MRIDLIPDSPVTDEACLAATGRTITQWIEAMEEQGATCKTRRDAISWLVPQMNKDFWWPTTIWVEMERRKGIVKKDGRAEGYNICSTKTVNAPIAAVFAAFATPGELNWFGGVVESDHSIKSPEGHVGTATRVRQDKDLRYVWQTKGSSDPSEVEVMLSEKAGKTGIIVNHNRIQTRNEADGLRRAWGEALTKLKQQLEA